LLVDTDIILLFVCGYWYYLVVCLWILILSCCLFVDTDIIFPQTNNKIISVSTNKQQDNISIHKQTTRSYQYPQTNNKIISVIILLFVCGYWYYLVVCCGYWYYLVVCLWILILSCCLFVDTDNNKIISVSTNKQQDNISIHKQTTRKYQYPQTNNILLFVCGYWYYFVVCLWILIWSCCLFVDTDIILLQTTR
jgi:hypothetical protein